MSTGKFTPEYIRYHNGNFRSYADVCFRKIYVIVCLYGNFFALNTGTPYFFFFFQNVVPVYLSLGITTQKTVILK
jgi:hypothetical protein